MTLRSLALATLLLVGVASPARADVTLYTPIAEAAGGSALLCAALNTGKKTIAPLTVQLVNPAGGVFAFIPCVSVDPGGACTVVGPGVGYCRIIFKGSKKAVRGNLTVRNTNGTSVLSIEAR